MLVEYEENIDILNLIIDYIVGTLDYNKNIFNKVIREIEIENNVNAFMQEVSMWRSITKRIN